MQDIKQLQVALLAVQDTVIGLFRPRFYPASEFIPVISNDKGTLECLAIGPLFGVSTISIGIGQGKYVQFPMKRELPNSADNFPPEEYTMVATLTDMKKNAIFFDEWYRANCYNSVGSNGTTEKTLLEHWGIKK